jgi:hypothetical protein
MIIKISQGEVSQLRRNVQLNPQDYSEKIRAIHLLEKDPLAFLAERNIWFKDLMLSEVFIEMLKAKRRGRKFNPEDYYDSNPILYRKAHPKFRTSSRDGYLVGRDFLTNQPIFRKY